MKNNRSVTSKRNNIARGVRAKTDASRVEELLEAEARAGKEVSPWRIFRIMSEFVNGFDFLRHYKKAVTVFGSARTKPNDPSYKEAYTLSYDLSKEGFVIITGAGPGIMEAANKGAYEAGGISAGIGIDLEFEQGINEYVTEAESFKYFFTRKTMLAYASQFYIFFPGGFGTLDELFELITLVQTKKIAPIPIILVDKEYWNPLLHWIDETLNKKLGNVSPGDIELCHLVDNAKEAHALVCRLAENGDTEAKKTTDPTPDPAPSTE